MEDEGVMSLTIRCCAVRKGIELMVEIRDELIDMCAGVLEDMLDKAKESNKAEDAMRYTLAACH